MQSLDSLRRTKGRIRENFFSLPNYLLAGTLVFCVQAQTELMPFSNFQQPISGFLSIHNQLCELIPYNKHIKYKYNKYTYVYMFVNISLYLIGSVSLDYSNTTSLPSNISYDQTLCWLDLPISRPYPGDFNVTIQAFVWPLDTKAAHVFLPSS